MLTKSQDHRAASIRYMTARQAIEIAARERRETFDLWFEVEAAFLEKQAAFSRLCSDRPVISETAVWPKTSEERV